jgi:putative flippase GtrA
MVRKPSAATKQQLGRFGMVGILNTVVDYVLFIGLTKVFSIPLEQVWIAKLISGSVAIANSFYFNRRWVFRHSNRHWGQQAWRFLASTLIGVFIIQTLLVQLFSNDYPAFGRALYNLVSDSGLSQTFGFLTEALVIKTTAFGIATIASLCWNFVLYKLWAFKE